MSEQDKKIIQELQEQFFEEFNDLSASTEICLMEMEKSNNPEHQKTLLRNLHSIKGSSRAVGFESLAIFTHDLETRISESKQKFDFNFLFQALDLMVEHIKLLKEDCTKEADQVLKKKINS